MARIEPWQLAVTSGGSEVLSLAATLAPVPGVQVTAASGLCGPGIGLLAITAAGLLSFKAPGSDEWGDSVDVSAGGDFHVCDGTNVDKWLAVTSTAAALPSTSAAGEVLLGELRLNAVAESDAAPEDNDQWELTLTNDDAANMTEIAVWLPANEPEARWLQTKLGAGSWTQVYNETAGATGQTLNASASVTLYLQRDVPAGTPADPVRRVRVRVSWNDNDGGRATVELRGVFGVTQTPTYQAYHTEDTDPIAGSDTPFASNATLPWTPVDVFGNGDHRFTVTYVNEYGLESMSLAVTRIIVDSGTQTGNPPVDPYALILKPMAEGEVRVFAFVPLPRDPDSAKRPDTWCLWYTTDGSAPGTGDPDVTASVTSSGRWIYDGIPAQDDGTTLRVLVRTRLSGVYSDGEQEAQLTIDVAVGEATKGIGWGAPA